MSAPQLVRALGLASVYALIVNIVIGASAFGVPGELLPLLGRRAPWACLAAGLCILVIGACFAEVASYFSAAGGPYLYARTAFGRFAGIGICWLMILVRITSVAAVCNLFPTYLARLWPAAGGDGERFVTLTLLVAVFAFINLRGIKLSAGVMNSFAVLKIGTLAAVIVAGLALLWRTETNLAAPAIAAPSFPASATFNDWVQGGLLLVFAYGGIEVGLVPMAEAKNPRRDGPVGALLALVTAIVLYTLLNVVVTQTVPLAAAKTAVAEAARSSMGAAGPPFVAMAALIAICGYLMACFVSGARLLYAPAEHGDLPRWFAAIHPRWQTPHHAIYFFAGVIWVAAILGSFRWAAVLSAVTRLVVYATVCAAVWALRRRKLEARFRVPGAPVLAAAGIGFCGLLLSRMRLPEFVAFGAVAAVSYFTWRWLPARD